MFFLGYVIFRMTSLKFTLGLTGISAFFNLLVIFLVLFAIFFGLIKSKFDRQSSIFFLLCSIFIFACFFNLALHWSVTGFLQTMEYILPWLALVMILVNRNHALANYKKYWNWFNKIIVTLIFLGLVEYFAFFILGISLGIENLAAGAGRYFVGHISLIQVIDDTDLPYFRFIGPFIEAGDLGMWASVLLVYNLLRKKYFYVAVLTLAIFVAYSPGALLALFIAAGAFLVSRSFIGFMFSLIILFFTILWFQNDIITFYNDILLQKALSLNDRKEGFVGFWQSLPYLLQAYPSGVPYFEDSSSRFSSGLSFAAVYSFVWAYEHGGVVAFSIYFLVIMYGFFVSSYYVLLTKYSLLNNEIYIYYLMLFTYIIQRATILEYAIVPLLFPIIFLGAFKPKGKESTESFNRDNELISSS